MGSPVLHYREMLVQYIRMNVSYTELSKKFIEEDLYYLSTEDLETLAKSFNRSNPKYAAYLCGSVVANVVNTLWEEGCVDGANASAASMCMIEELFNIVVPDNVDFMFEQGKPILEKLEDIKRNKDPID